jgi:hypothetical protein
MCTLVNEHTKINKKLFLIVAIYEKISKWYLVIKKLRNSGLNQSPVVHPLWTDL